jgi:uncharacterized protein YwqG
MGNLWGILFNAHKPSLPQPAVQTISNQLASVKLSQLVPDIIRLAKPSIRLLDQTSISDEQKSGTSRLGGQPDLPPGASWPVGKSLPLSFVAQIRLEEIVPYDVEHLLPPAGLLSFYYDSSQQTYGSSPSDRGGWSVIYLSGDPSQWQPCPFPAALPDSARFKPVPLSFRTEWSLPSAPEQVDPRLGWSEDEIQRYEQWLIDRVPADQRALPHHRMLGYPDQIQDDMQLQSALVTHGFTSLDQPGAKIAAESKGNWYLLLQIDSDSNAGMRWGSAGMIYYWIEQANLKASRFNQTWLIQQSD